MSKNKTHLGQNLDRSIERRDRKRDYRQFCRYCGKPGARTIVAFGHAHKRCIPK